MIRRTLSRLFGKRALQQKRRRPSPAPDVSSPELLKLWASVRSEYFPSRVDLDTFTVRWSRRRQKRVLASCSLKRRLVSVAREMTHEEAKPWLNALLYHEMCHAALGEDVGLRGEKRAWHGRKFRDLEAKHPESKALDHWIRSGGWSHVVRCARASTTAKKRSRSR